MIYSFGTLGWYSTKANRQYDNTGNENILHHFVTDAIPDFQVVIADTITTATYYLYDIDDVQIKTGSCTVSNETNNEGTAYSIIKLTGATTTSEDDGKYSLKVTYDGTDMFSDVFCWRTTVTDYLKISAAVDGIAIGGFPLDSFTYAVYLDTILPDEEFELKVVGDEKTYGDIPASASSNIVKTFVVTGYNKTLNFIARLAVLEINGTVTVTWKGDAVEVYDIQHTEKQEDFGNDIYIINLKFKQKDYLQSYNNI
jgi:hypothetical protein